MSAHTLRIKEKLRPNGTHFELLLMLLQALMRLGVGRGWINVDEYEKFLAELMAGVREIRDGVRYMKSRPLPPGII